MTSIDLLVVSIKDAWRPLIEESLKEAGYQYRIQYADNKQETIKLCRQNRYDLVICNCTLSDGTVADLMNVLGSTLPCLVMAEGVCPVSSGNSLSLAASNFFITHSDKSTWIQAMKDTLNEWEGRAHERITQFRKESSDLYSNALRWCEKEMSVDRFQLGDGRESKMRELCSYLLSVLDLSRISVYIKKTEENGENKTQLLAKSVSPGIELFERGNSEDVFTIYPRWDFLFSQQMNVFSPFAVITDEERRWIMSRGTQSLMAVPVTDGNHWQLFFLLEDIINPRKWSAGEVELIEAVAGLVKAAFIPSYEKDEPESNAPRIASGL